MRVIKKICNGIDVASDWSGRVVSWIVVILIVTVTFEVIMRYIFNAPTRWSFDVSYMLLAIFVSVGFAYVLGHRGHVRIDVLYARFPPKGKLIIDIVFTLSIFFPLFSMLTVKLFQDAWYAFQVKETAFITFWYPITWPYKTLVAFAIALLFLQGVAVFLKDVMSLIKGGKEPW